MRRLILSSRQSPGDILMLTAAVRELHRSHPGQFATDVRTPVADLWENNPYLTPLDTREAGVESIEMHYPLIHQSNQRPYHFLHGYAQFLEDRLKVRLPLTEFRGDVHLNDAEKATPPDHLGELPERFWILIAGGKYDFTAKWWNPESYQAVVDHFRGRTHFVQCGEAGHWHPPLTGVTNLVGKTSIRDFVRLMHFAEGVICPVTFAMHLAAAVPVRSGGPPNRACVVIAGGREPPQWEAYPQHQYLHTIGQLDCCATGGCWKSRCQPVGDGDRKDRHDRCVRPVSVSDELTIPQCLEMIRPEDVIRAVERTLEGWTMSHTKAIPAKRSTDHSAAKIEAVPSSQNGDGHQRRRVRLEFRHGLGDAVQLTAVLRHLRHYHPDWDVEVASLLGKHTAFQGLCSETMILNGHAPPGSKADEVHALEWHENRAADGRWPNTKVTRCLQEVFRLTPIEELCRYEIVVSEAANQAARDYLESVCGPPGEDGRYPAVLIHYEGNTSESRKNLPVEVVRNVCEVVLEGKHVPVILDWDRRSPLPDGQRIHCPDAQHPYWLGAGTGDAERLAALIGNARLMIGVDSGPLHVAGATSTPTIGVWTKHHPLQFFDLADHVEHLVPANHLSFVGSPAASEYFRKAYRHRVYRDLFTDLPNVVACRLSEAEPELEPGQRFRNRLRSTAFDTSYYVEHQQAGLDYLNYGDWQREYGRWFVESLTLKGKRLLDVGCACGAILRGLGEAGAIVQGVDLNEHMIQLGRQQWPDMAPLMHVCDAVNLHLFGNESWDAIHSAQVAEHWKPELVPFILRELHRIVVPGGLFFCCLDTEELFARQGRRLEDEDPTHVCVKPLSWWHELLETTGWELCGDHVHHRLATHPLSFLGRYDWEWFVARRLG